jgi:hypothetical protein
MAIKNRIRFATWLLMMLPSVVAAAQATHSLPAAWKMDADEDYSNNADYVPPKPVPGLIVHGFEANDSIEVVDGKVVLEGTGRCTGEIVFEDLRGLPSTLPSRTLKLFWYFRAGDQALYLSREWVYEAGKDCRGIARLVTRMVRVVWLNGAVTLIEIGDKGVADFATERLDSPVYGKKSLSIPSHLLQIDGRDFVETGRSRLVRREPSRRTQSQFGTTRHRQTCFGLSAAFAFVSRCYYSGEGNWHGLLLSAERAEHGRDNYAESGTLDFDPNAMIDGRLFEWDREIQSAEKPK